MKLSAFFVSSVALFSVAFARPSRLAERVAAREARRSRPNTVIAENNSTHVEYSENWAGVVLTSPPAGQTFTTVTGTFTVPTVSGKGAASAWVGIDGDTASQSILQSGVDFFGDEGGATYAAWFEWYPNYASDFENFPVSVGDVITVTVHSTNPTTGTVTLSNESTGETVTKDLSAPDDSAALQGKNAEWIVEDFEENGSLVPFADFKPVTFVNATASTASEFIDPSGGTVVDIVQNGRVLTSVSTSGSLVTITREP